MGINIDAWLGTEQAQRYREFLEKTTKGIRCSCCKRPYDFSDTGWHWDGKYWEHKCPDNHAQAGYFTAEKIEGE